LAIEPPPRGLAGHELFAPDVRLRVCLGGVTVGVFALFLYSFTVGPYPIPIPTVVSVFLHRFHLVDKSWSDAVELVILNIRGPRIAAALLVGAALAMAGATYQNLFRNPLVSPAVLGVSAGAGFGAALGIILGITGMGIQLMAFLAGLAAVAMTLWLGCWLNRHAMLVLVLAGLVVSAFFQALISLLKVTADPLDQLPTITFWLLGGLHRITAATVLTALGPIGAAGFVLYALRWPLNVLAAGDDEARALGVNVSRVRLALIIAATLMTAACVSISGIVGWVGLLIPHIVRMLVGPSFPAVLPMCALIGGGFLLAVDDLARAAGANEIPLGILTALIGAPFFALVLARTRQAWF
jgi:iron complex transport system permease protein